MKDNRDILRPPKKSQLYNHKQKSRKKNRRKNIGAKFDITEQFIEMAQKYGLFFGRNKKVSLNRSRG